MKEKTAIEKMVVYAESWLDSGVEYSRGQIVEAMVNKARDLASLEAKEKLTRCEYICMWLEFGNDNFKEAK